MPDQLYLDVCSLCRPFDDQSFIRIRLETEAVNLILANVRTKKYKLLVSKVHLLEIAAIPDLSERIQIEMLIRHEGKTINTDLRAVQNRTEELISKGFGIADAAHVAFAESQEADFISCDDRLIQKCLKLVIKTWAGTTLAVCDKEKLS